MSKTLQICRPDGLSMYRRNVSALEDYRGVDTERLKSGLDSIQRSYDGSGTHDMALSLLDYAIRGGQMVCDLALSRDLELSRVTGTIDALAWPATSLHITFQDTDLPSCILSRRAVGERGNYGFSMLMEGKDGTHSCVLIGQAEWDRFIGGEDFGENPVGGDVRLSIDEFAAVHYMAALCAKVLAYASIPRHAETLLRSRAEKKSAGIHPSQQNATPAILVRHLPRIVSDNNRVSETSAGSHAFLGRAGHLRLYSDPRYRNMQGKWQWIPPIPPPEGVRVIYKVRKIKEAA